MSIKLLPPPGQGATEPVHYGIVTQGAVARIEIDHPEVQTFCLATSTEDFSSSRPSSWSGALDQIASGGSPADAGDPPRTALNRPKRLLLTAAGNVVGGMRADITEPRPIEDPAQSWNALTIGGYTTKETVAVGDAPQPRWRGPTSSAPSAAVLRCFPTTLRPSSQRSCSKPRESGRGFGFVGMMLVEETLQQRLASALAFCASTLERIDSTQRLTHLAVACRLLGGEHRSWVSQAEASRIAATGSMSMGVGGADPEPVSVTVRRAALNLDAGRIVEDLIVPLRRHWRRQT